MLFLELRQLKLIQDRPFVHCDNSGKNRTLQEVLKQEKFGAEFEFSAPGSPHFSGVVECKFATLYACVRSTLNSACLSQELRSGLWAEAAKFATDVENCLVTEQNTVSSWLLFYGKEHPLVRNVRQFGEVAVVDDWKKPGHHAKLDNRGKPALYLGHADSHASDCFQFLNLETNRVIVSRDVTWLNKTYATFKGIDGMFVVNEEDSEPVDVIVTGTSETAVVPQPQVAIVAVPDVPDPVDTPVAATQEAVQEVVPPVDPKVVSELNHLDANIADVDVSQGRTLRSGGEIGHLTIDDLALFTVVNCGSLFPDFVLKSVDPSNLKPAQYKDYFEVPTTFNEAWNHPCEIQHKLWREAIGVELTKMMTYKVWRKVKCHIIPKNCKCVKCKWVFDIKRNGVFRVRLVACGYSCCCCCCCCCCWIPVMSRKSVL
jgi:hypothetical protein